MNVIPSLLPLVVEVEGRNRATVERVFAALKLLRPVDMAETNEVEVCRRQSVGINDRFKLAEKRGLTALHVAARNGVMRQQYRRYSGNALRLEADNHIGYGFGKYLVLLLF